MGSWNLSGTVEQRYFQAVNRVTKWRTLLTGWQLGTRPKGDPEGDAVRDQRELLILLRMEVNALNGLLVAKGAYSREEYMEAIIEECEAMDADFMERFPGVTSHDHGLKFSKQVLPWMKGWKP